LQPNAFLTFAESFGVGLTATEETQQGVGKKEAAEVPFRQTMSLTIANNDPTAELNISFAAWVLPSSLRSREQEDALLQGGYARMAESVWVGSAFVLPQGTWVLQNGGVAGAKALRLPPAQQDGSAITPSEFSTELVTPDVLLLFAEPPESCESVGFFFTNEGAPADDRPITSVGGIFSGAVGQGARKTLAQIDAYQCQPFRPGLFLNRTGGRLLANEFFEGQSVRVDCFREPVDEEGHAAVVTIE